MAARTRRQAPSRTREGEDPAVPRPVPEPIAPPQERRGGEGLLGGAVQRQLDQEADIKELQRQQRINRNR